MNILELLKQWRHAQDLVIVSGEEREVLMSLVKELSNYVYPEKSL